MGLRLWNEGIMYEFKGVWGWKHRTMKFFRKFQNWNMIYITSIGYEIGERKQMLLKTKYNMYIFLFLYFSFILFSHFFFCFSFSVLFHFFSFLFHSDMLNCNHIIRTSFNPKYHSKPRYGRWCIWFIYGVSYGIWNYETKGYVKAQRD